MLSLRYNTLNFFFFFFFVAPPPPIISRGWMGGEMLWHAEEKVDAEPGGAAQCLNEGAGFATC